MPITDNRAMQDCIDLCTQCHAACLNSVPHCLDIGGNHAATPHIRLLLDCSQVCRVAADFMLRNSERHALVCGLCADLCEQCADECERFDNDDVMHQCAQVCRRCADSCRGMAGAGV